MAYLENVMKWNVYSDDFVKEMSAESSVALSPQTFTEIVKYHRFSFFFIFVFKFCSTLTFNSVNDGAQHELPKFPPK